MTTSTSRLDLQIAFPGMASREMGSVALAKSIDALADAEVLELDFGGASPSPSFADQCIGGLASRLGLDVFRVRVRIKNLAPDASPLLRHVVLRRSAEYRPAH
jgi:hypothetical protein